MKTTSDLKVVFLDFTGTIDRIPHDTPTRYEKRKVYLPKKEKKGKFGKFTGLKDGDNDYYPRTVDTYEDLVSRHGFGYEDEEYGVGAYDYQGGDSYFKSFPVYDSPNKTCLKLLKDLLDKTGAKIVYSSTRRWDGWERCADFLGLDYKYSLGHPVFGVTPELPMEPIVDIHPLGSKGRSVIYTPNNDEDGVVTYSYKEREKEIKEWFKQWPGKPLRNYVILDDDPINDPKMKLHWVPSIRKNGFREEEYKQALRILGGR